jgi:hypothetical protein
VKLLGDAISRFQADHFDPVGFLSAEAFPFIASGRERDRLALCDTEPAGDGGWLECPVCWGWVWVHGSGWGRAPLGVEHGWLR